MKLKRIVVKIGTNVILGDGDRPAEERITRIAQSVHDLMNSGTDVVVVTSGAVGLGRRQLGLNLKLSLAEKQASAAAGQPSLMNLWKTVFGRHQRTVAQVLLTSGDFSDRRRYLNLRDTLEALLKLHAIPILNENDSVSVEELQEGRSRSFGDNDRLAALVAGKIRSDLLVLITDVAGVFNKDPKVDKSAERLKIVEDLSALQAIEKKGASSDGRGGMDAKIEAARIAVLGGVPTLIASVDSGEGLASIASAKSFEDLSGWGTIFLPKLRWSGKKGWIALASGHAGVLVINEGAVTALFQKKASLLPGGVTAVQGSFSAGDVVSIQDEHGNEVGRGVSSLSARDLKKVKGLNTKECSKVLGETIGEAIHRDNLVSFEDRSERKREEKSERKDDAGR